MPVPYAGLNYSAFIYQSAGTDGIAQGVVPHSQPNYAANGAFARIRAGNPTLTIDGTNVTNFDLQSFWYGCYLTQPAEQAQLATSCSFTVTGTKAVGGSKTLPKAFNYAPTSTLSAAMVQATFDSTFKKLSSAEVELTAGNPTILTTDFVLDSAMYVVHRT